MPADEPLTRESILAAAEDVLRRFGPTKATVVDVAKASGVSHAAPASTTPSTPPNGPAPASTPNSTTSGHSSCTACKPPNAHENPVHTRNQPLSRGLALLGFTACSCTSAS